MQKVAGREGWHSIESPSRNLHGLALVAILVFAIGLRILAAQGDVELDEVFTFDVVAQNGSGMLHEALLDYSHPPAHIFLLYAWVAAFGSDPFTARALTIVLSVASLYLVYRITRRIMPASNALASTLVLAVSPFFVFYGQQARPYGLVMFATALNVLAFLRTVTNVESRSCFAIWSASCWLLVWTHYMGAVLLIPQFLQFLHRHWRIQQAVRLLPAALSIVAVVVWLAMGVRARLLDSIPLDATAWMAKPTLRDLLALPNVLLGIPFVSAIGALVFWSVPAVSFTRWRDRVSAPVVALLACVVILPASLYAFSLTLPFSVWAERQLAGVAMLAVVAWAWMLAWSPASFRVGITTAAVLSAAVGLPDVIIGSQRPPWRDVVAFVESQGPDLCVGVNEWWTRKQLTYVSRRADMTVVQVPEQDLPMPCEPQLFVCRVGRCEYAVEALGRGSTVRLSTFSWAPALGVDRKSLAIFTRANVDATLAPSEAR